MSEAPRTADGPVFAVRALVKHFAVRDGGLFASTRATVRAVDGVDLVLSRRETLALVGESGCGKTTLARAAAFLTPPTSGSIRFDGRELRGLSRRELKPARRRIQTIFQDPYGSLNPRLPVGAIIAEPLVIHGLGNRSERRKRAAQVAESVGLNAGDLSRYPHQFSGGQRQRIAIARALAPEPDVIIADEPVSALDVSIQSQVLNLLEDLQDAHDLAYLFISHDLAVVRHLADRVAVMYLGRIVEQARAGDLFRDPRHPYTRALIAAAPEVGRGKRKPGSALGGEVPSPLNPPAGCPFHPRCPLAREICGEIRPELEPPSRTLDHLSACHFREQAGGAP